MDSRCNAESSGGATGRGIVELVGVRSLTTVKRGSFERRALVSDNMLVVLQFLRALTGIRWVGEGYSTTTQQFASKCQFEH